MRLKEWKVRNQLLVVRGRRREFDFGFVTGDVLVGETTIGGAALVPKRKLEGPLARVLDDLKRGGAGVVAEANGGAVKRSG